MVDTVLTNGLYYVTDAAPGAVPYRIGRRAFEVGRHVVGFDDGFAEPVVMRAFYDADLRDRRVRDATWLAYTQQCRLTFADTYTVPPSAYGGRLADRDPYLTPDGWWVDMMGPADAALRNVPLPVYAYNNMLSSGIRDMTQLYAHPLPNGSLRYLLEQPQSGMARYASISADLGAGLLTPADVASVLDDADVVRWFDVTRQEAAETEPYRLALTSLEQRVVGTETAPPLQGLDESQVAARVVGPYVLLTLPDDEAYPATLCVSTMPSPDTAGYVRVVVHVLSWYDLDELERGSGTRALGRIRDYLGLQPIPLAVTGRGMRPVASLPAGALSRYVLALEVRTCVVASTPTGTWPIDAFSWAILFEFDADSGSLEATTVRAPVEAQTFDVDQAIRTFRAAREAAPTATVDTTNFTLAAMRRDDFGGGRKLAFVNQAGQSV